MRGLTILVSAALALSAGAWAQARAADPAPAPAATADKSPAMAGAEANRTRMKTPPRATGKAALAYPDSEKTAGHAGRVSVRGIVGVDGRVTEASVVLSSAGPVLDAAALAAVQATVFQPAKDADGQPIAVVVTFPVEFGTSDLNPVYVTRAANTYPDEEREAGHFGKVVIAGKVGADGRLVDPVVQASSHAPGLDAAAMTAATASIYRVSRGPDGKVVETPIAVEYEFDSFHSPGEGGGVLRYSCEQFAKDQTWWRSVWPAETKDDFYHLMLGLTYMVRSQGGGVSASNIRGVIDDFDKRWGKAIEACRAKPKAMMIDVFKPEGDWARKLAQTPAAR